MQPFVSIDLFHNTPHLCTRFMFAGIKAMSRGISGGKQVPIGRLLQSVILWAVFSIPAIAVEFVYSLKIKRRVIFTCVNEIVAIYGRSLAQLYFVNCWRKCICVNGYLNEKNIINSFLSFEHIRESKDFWGACFTQKLECLNDLFKQ